MKRSAFPMIIALVQLVLLGASRTVFADLESLLPLLRTRTEAAQVSAQTPGVVAGLFDKDGLIVASAGLRQAGGTEPMQTEDPVFLGSTFKSITATLVARYVDRGILSWDSTLSTLFSETPIADGYRDVTIQQILSHRGGFDDELDFVADDPFEGTPSEERAHFLPLIMAEQPSHAVGEFSYSNIGYTAAGAILEHVSGKAFDEIVQTELVDTLGLSSLSFGPPASVAGHDANGIPASLDEQELPPAIGPAGLYSMNLEDWSKVVRQHCVGSDFVSAESLAILHTPIGDPIDGSDGVTYALGWGVATIEDETLLTHNGSNGYWLSTVLVNPEACRAVLVSSNQENAGEMAIELIGGDPTIVQWVAAVPEPNGGAMMVAAIGWLVLQRRRSTA